MTLWCITNEVPDLRPCTVPNEHHEACNGWDYRWSEEAREETATGKPCPGCFPIRAEKGHVCGRCYDKIISAEATYGAWRPMMRGITRAITPEPTASHAIGYVPLSALALDEDAIQRARQSFPGRLDMWISTPEGAADAVRFANATRTAVKNHPTRESPRRLTRTVCPACRRPTLLWHPPEAAGADIRVSCADPACGHVLPDQSIEDVAYIEKSVYRRRTP